MFIHNKSKNSFLINFKNITIFHFILNMDIYNNISINLPIEKFMLQKIEKALNKIIKNYINFNIFLKKVKISCTTLNNKL